MRRLFVVFLLLLEPILAFAHPADTYEFRSPEIQRRATTLARELRCPQCQNQNLLESNSPIASDLRLEVYRLVDGGKSDEEVIAYMTDRFGGFVRYDPPFNMRTLALWGAPALLLLFALLMLTRIKKRDRTTDLSAYSEKMSDAPNDGAPEPLHSQDDIRAKEDFPPVRSRKLAPAIVVGSMLVVAVCYGATGRWQEAMRWRAPDPLAGLTGEELKDASEKRLEARIRENPRDLEAWAELGQLYTYRDRYEQALLVYDRIAEIEGTMNASTAAAKATVIYYQAGQLMTPQARGYLDQALASDPGEVTALMLLASDHFLQAEYKQAIAIWQKLLDEGRPRVNREQLIRAIQTARQFGG